MKIYVVKYETEDGDTITIGAYSTKAIARKAIKNYKALSEDDSIDARIEPWILDSNNV